MRLDFTPPDRPIDRFNAWAASTVLTFAVVGAFLVAWFLAVEYLIPVIGFGAVVLLAIFAGALSYCLGRVRPSGEFGSRAGGSPQSARETCYICRLQTISRSKAA